jgi:uncharacterized protein (TIGR02271 family)
LLSTDNIDTLIGANVVDSDGDKIGTVGQIYLDTTTNQPSWASVRTGLFGMSESFVPLSDATRDGDDLRVQYSKEQVKGAPRVDDDASLSEEDERNLYSYYGVGYDSPSSVDYDTSNADYDTTSNREFATSSAGQTNVGSTSNTGVRPAGYDTSGPTTDDAMTLSEERLNVGTERVEAGRARLRKHVVTEQQTTTVPVSHEEVRLEREPITDANVHSALAGPAISEEEHEVVLTEERAVVDKETVPVERVRLGTETVTENEQVTESVRHEEVELDGDVDVDRDRNRDIDGNRR